MPTREARATLTPLAAWLAAAAIAASAAGPTSLRAQQRDSVRADSAARADSANRARAAEVARRGRERLADTTPRPPITPRRAFLTSLAVPGLGQTRLGRPNAAALFGTIEAIALLMARKSALDLRTARYRSRDSVVVGYEINPTTGAVQRDPETGAPIAVFGPANPLADRLSSRRTHYEDWVALLIFNHFFSGADAFVAAQLWDLPAEVSLKPMDRGLAIAATVRF